VKCTLSTAIYSQYQYHICTALHCTEADGRTVTSSIDYKSSTDDTATQGHWVVALLLPLAHTMQLPLFSFVCAGSRKQPWTNLRQISKFDWCWIRNNPLHFGHTSPTDRSSWESYFCPITIWPYLWSGATKFWHGNKLIEWMIFWGRSRLRPNRGAGLICRGPHTYAQRTSWHRMHLRTDRFLVLSQCHTPDGSAPRAKNVLSH